MADDASLRKRLTWYLIGVMVLVMLVSGILIYRDTLHEADEVFDASLVQTARILSGLISRDSVESSREQLEQALERGPDAHKYERKLFFAVFDADGKRLLHSRGAPEIARDAIESGFSRIHLQAKNWFIFTLESDPDNLLIVVGEQAGIREEITEYIGGDLVLPLLLMLPAIIWLLWHIVGVALRPLQSVADQVRQQNLKDLKPIDVVGVPREIGPLVTALNQMIADLDAAYARERRFAGDAAHELRNPLAGLLINVDNALEESHGREVVDSLQGMKASIQRLSRLVGQLLELSRFENPRASHQFQPVDPAQICRGVAAEFAGQAAARDIELELSLPDKPCSLDGVEPLLNSLLSNLVDNAIKFSDEGSRVRIGCVCEGSEIMLRVEDSGAGLEPGEHERVLGRFYRAGDTNKPGAGLGLSIVKSIADIHAATVELGESGLGGLRIEVRFGGQQRSDPSGGAAILSRTLPD